MTDADVRWVGLCFLAAVWIALGLGFAALAPGAWKLVAVPLGIGATVLTYRALFADPLR